MPPARNGWPSAATPGPEGVIRPLVGQDLIANAQKALSISTTCAPANPAVVSTSVSPARGCPAYGVNPSVTLGGVLDDVDLHPFGATLMDADALGRRLREVDDSTLAAPIRSTIIDFNDHVLLRPEIRDLDLRP
jgi:hypothetical protein